MAYLIMCEIKNIEARLAASTTEVYNCLINSKQSEIIVFTVCSNILGKGQLVIRQWSYYLAELTPLN